MSFSKRIVMVLSMVATAAVSGCGDMAIPPAGSYSEILLVTEGGEQDEWTRRLTPVIARDINYYVDFEKQFRIVPIKASEMDDVPPYKNIVMQGTVTKMATDGTWLIDQLANKYLGHESYQFGKPGEVRVNYEIEIESIGSWG